MPPYRSGKEGGTQSNDKMEQVEQVKRKGGTRATMQRSTSERPGGREEHVQGQAEGRSTEQ